MYVKALLDRIIVLQYFVFIIFASLSIYHIVEKANLSTLDLREHKFSVSNLGNISVLRSTRYTVVHLFLAYRSKAESGLT